MLQTSNNLKQRKLNNFLYVSVVISFIVPVVFLIFRIDYVHSAKIVSRLKAFAYENNVTLRYEEIKIQIRKHHERTKQKYHFFLPFYSEKPISEHLKEMPLSIESRKHKRIK